MNVVKNTLTSSGYGRLTGKVLQDLQSMIITNHLPARTKLFESQLADRLGVSRTPVREALRLLNASSLIVPRSGGGYEVAAIDADVASQHYELRGAIEGVIGARAASNRQTTDVDRLYALLRIAESELEASTSYLNYGKEFHRLIREMAGAPIIQTYLEGLEVHFDRYRHITQGHSSDRRRAFQEHMDIARAIDDGDVPRVKAVINHHMMSGKRALLDALDY